MEDKRMNKRSSKYMKTSAIWSTNIHLLNHGRDSCEYHSADGPDLDLVLVLVLSLDYVPGLTTEASKALALTVVERCLRMRRRRCG